EPPGKGEGTRRLLEQSHNFSREGMGAYFLTLCRNKESVALDLKSEEGLKLFYELAKHADIVMSNFGAGVTTRLKIDFAHLSKINPRIITCAISGFGEPDRRRIGPRSIWWRKAWAAACRSPVMRMASRCARGFRLAIWRADCSARWAFCRRSRRGTARGAVSTSIFRCSIASCRC